MSPGSGTTSSSSPGGSSGADPPLRMKVLLPAGTARGWRLWQRCSVGGGDWCPQRSGPMSRVQHMRSGNFRCAQQLCVLLTHCMLVWPEITLMMCCHGHSSSATREHCLPGVRVRLGWGDSPGLPSLVSKLCLKGNALNSPKIWLDLPCEHSQSGSHLTMPLCV